METSRRLRRRLGMQDLSTPEKIETKADSPAGTDEPPATENGSGT